MTVRTQTSAKSLSFFSIKENDLTFGESEQKLFEWAFRAWDMCTRFQSSSFPCIFILFVTMLNYSQPSLFHHALPIWTNDSHFETATLENNFVYTRNKFVESSQWADLTLRSNTLLCKARLLTCPGCPFPCDLTAYIKNLTSLVSSKN